MRQSRKILTAKQRRFVNEYLIDLNGTQAAIRAGYSAKTARAIASETLKKPAVAACLARRSKTQNRRMELRRMKVLDAMLRIIDADKTSMYQEDESFTDPETWAPEAWDAVESVSFHEYLGKGERGKPRPVRTKIRIKFYDLVKLLIHLDKQSNPARPQEPSAPIGTVQYKGFLTPAEARQFYPNAWPAILERQWARFDEFEKELMREKEETGGLKPGGQLLLDDILRDKKERPQVRLQIEAWRQRSSAQTRDGSITPLK